VDQYDAPVSASTPPLPGLLPNSAWVLGGGLGGLTIVALFGAAARPELWHAGLGQVALAVAAAVGTGASACVAITALFGPWLATRRLVLGGEAAALEAVGWGRADLLRSIVPLALGLVVLAAAAGLAVEPAAWTAVHRVKGSPALAAAAWARLESGAVHTLPDGGAVVFQERRLRFTTGDGGWSGALEDARPAVAGWSFGASRIDAGEGGAWSMDRLELRLESPEAWTEPPSSPWAARFGALYQRRDEPRARRVLHRRMALIAAVLPLAALGLGLGWSRRRRSLWMAALMPAAVFLSARLADTSAVSPLLAGWAPAGVACAAAFWVWRRPS
jgi:hypothetical protein